MQETSLGDHKDMRKLKPKTPADHIDEAVMAMAGFKFNMQYLGCCEELDSGGTDHEIANVIHDIYVLYGKKNSKLRKARDVIIFVDSDKIDIFDKYEDEILLGFPLAHVKAVTTCLDQVPYSKTCVLVARGYNEPLYKAFVFFCKTAAQAAEFHHFTSIAFQIGFKKMEKRRLKSAPTTDEEILGSSSDSRFRSVIETAEIFSPNDEECDAPNEFGKNVTEMQNLITSDSEFVRLKNEDKRRRRKSSTQEKTVTVQLSNSGNDCDTREKRKIKFNLSLADENNNLSQSKLDIFMDAVGQSRSVPIPNWFRNSYRKLRKMTSYRQQSYGSTQPDAQTK